MNNLVFFRKAVLVTFLWLSATALFANNIIISNVSSVVAGTTQIEFDLSWENSWRTSTAPDNWDAVWIFIKYKDADGVWKHLDLTGSDNSIASGYSITVPSDKKGAFIYRDVDGNGNVSLTDVKLGVARKVGTFDVRIFGIEMVYVKTGDFYVGDGNGATESSEALHSGTTNSAVKITGSLVSDIRVDGFTIHDDGQLKDPGIGIDGDGGLDTNNDGIIDNPFFPTGHSGFYCMKYEISQKGYIDFLNTLTYTQQAFNTNAAPNGAVGLAAIGQPGVYIEIATAGVNPTLPAVYGTDADGDNILNEANDGEWIAMYGINWPRLCAWLDWAALRPMTELEYEKACRGPVNPVLNEFAWGDITIFATPYTLANAATASEAATNAATAEGNAIYGSTQPSLRPRVRSGMFATSSSTRVSAGASYYGIMEMSGNVWERTVNVGTNAGRSFTGNYGNGNLNSAGHADVDFWPGINGNSDGNTANNSYGGTIGVTNAAGSGWRGGDPAEVVGRLRVSDRIFASYQNTLSNMGGRGVRHSELFE